jgi:hypothetical protein
LTVGSSGFGEDALLSHWRWLVGDSMQLLPVSALGDLFLVGVPGRVPRLDVGRGQMKSVASGVEESRRPVEKTTPAPSSDHLAIQLVARVAGAAAAPVLALPLPSLGPVS